MVIMMIVREWQSLQYRKLIDPNPFLSAALKGVEKSFSYLAFLSCKSALYNVALSVANEHMFFNS